MLCCALCCLLAAPHQGHGQQWLARPQSLQQQQQQQQPWRQALPAPAFKQLAVLHVRAVRARHRKLLLHCRSHTAEQLQYQHQLLAEDLNCSISSSRLQLLCLQRQWKQR
jgi:hypothetical protein